MREYSDANLIITCINEHKITKIVNEALDTLKEISNEKNIWLRDKNGKCFKLTKDCEVILTSSVDKEIIDVLFNKME